MRQEGERLAKEDNPTSSACIVEGGRGLDVSLGLPTCHWSSPADVGGYGSREILWLRGGYGSREILGCTSAHVWDLELRQWVQSQGSGLWKCPLDHCCHLGKPSRWLLGAGPWLGKGWKQGLDMMNTDNFSQIFFFFVKRIEGMTYFLF